jgi:hypothetical protein
MRRERVWVALFLVAAGIGGTWVATEIPEPAQTVRTQAPVSQPAGGTPAQFTDASAPAPSIDDVMRQAADSVTRRPLCVAPPVELTEEQKRIVDEALSKAPIPTVPPDTPGGVINVHRRLVPC